MLDIATGAGHTALAFAPNVAKITAIDITPEMLSQTRRLAKERELGNVVATRASADHLPFPDTSYNLVTCRLAAHHFGDPAAFVREATRVLIPDGIFALVDNIAPEDESLAARYNAFEKLRDPSHGHCLGLDEWRGITRDAGLTATTSEIMEQDIAFDPWVARMRCAPDTITRLKDMLHAEPLRALLRPRETEDGLTFTLREAIVLAKKPTSNKPTMRRT